MSELGQGRPVVLDHLPAATFRSAVEYLDDVLRECQLVLAGADGADPDLVVLAAGLVPDLEEVGDSFRASTLTKDPDGSLRLVGSMEVSQSATLANLQVQLVRLRLLGRRGGMLIESDPEATQLITWMWEEASDQLYGRAPRPYRAAT